MFGEAALWEPTPNHPHLLDVDLVTTGFAFLFLVCLYCRLAVSTRPLAGVVSALRALSTVFIVSRLNSVGCRIYRANSLVPCGPL